MDLPKPSKIWSPYAKNQTTSAPNSPFLPQNRPSPITTSASKKLEDARIIQRTLVFIINLPSSAADEQALISPTYFGKYGKIVKIHLSQGHHNAPDTTYAAYLTFSNEEEAAVCIRVCSDFILDGKRLTLTYGTTKYCSYFLKNVKCPKLDCVFLHFMASDVDTLFREDMNINKHIQPQNSVFDRLKVIISPPVPPSKLPEFRILRDRAYSETVAGDFSPLPATKVHSRECSGHSRYRFAKEEEGDSVEIPQFVNILRHFASPCKEVAIVPRKDIEPLIDPQSPVKWLTDVMDVNMEGDTSKNAIVSKKQKTELQ